MVVPDSSTSAPGRKQSASPITSELRYPSEEIIPDSEDEAASMLTGATAGGPLGENSSSNRHGSEGDRLTSQQPPPDGAPTSNVLPPRMSRPGGNGQDSLHKHAVSEANRRAGDRQEPAKNDPRRERNEQHTADKRPYQPSDTRRRDSREGRGHSSARAGGETEAQKGRRSPEEARSTRDVREDKGLERKEDTERRGGAGGENRHPGSSSTRSYAVVVGTPPDLKSGPQHKPGSSPTDVLPGGLTNKQGPAGVQRHATPRPHGRSDGYSNPNDQPGNTEPQDRRKLGAATAQPSSYPPSLDSDTDETQEGDQQRAQQESQQGSSGKGIFGRIGNMLGGGGSSAPSECRCKEHEQTIMAMQTHLRDANLEIERLAHQRQRLSERLHNTDGQVRSLTERLHLANTELTNVHKELVDAKALSETRGKELIGAQTFLTKADSISMSEIVGLARTVNNEIFQTAASLCDSFVPEHYMLTDGELHDLRTRVQGTIGDELTKLMENIPDKSMVNPLFAQIVIQALFSSYFANGIETWYDEDEPHAEELLVRLHNDIRRTENQAVSGRWRALTRARLRPKLDKWLQELFQHLTEIIHLAGWTVTDPEFAPALQEKLRPIFKAVEKLRRAMGEQFTSADIEMAIPEQYSMFNPHKMEDDWGDARSTNPSVREVVGGTTGIGLKQRVAHDNADEIISYEIILPPKVVLMSSLKEIAEPPPPRPRRTKASGGGGPGASG